MSALEPIRWEERVDPASAVRRVRRERSPSEEENAGGRARDDDRRRRDEEPEEDDGLPHIDVTA